MQKINQTVLMSGADYMSNASPINPYMHEEPFNVALATQQHTAIKQALEAAGIAVVSVPPPVNCQDGIFTANWALVRGDKALLASLPTVRRAETAHAKATLESLGKTVTQLPEGIRFSGQGDALPCGDYVFAGAGYRTDTEAHKYIAATLGYTVIPVQTVPLTNTSGTAVINQATGWPDSHFYDIDLAISILRWPTEDRKGLIAWCPEAFVPDSQERLRALEFVDKIEVSLEEAIQTSACNLVSTGTHVVMNARAPQLQAAIESHGILVTALENSELAKNGGSVRCTTLTLSN